MVVAAGLFALTIYLAAAGRTGGEGSRTVAEQPSDDSQPQEDETAAELVPEAIGPGEVEPEEVPDPTPGSEDSAGSDTSDEGTTGESSTGVAPPRPWVSWP